MGPQVQGAPGQDWAFGEGARDPEASGEGRKGGNEGLEKEVRRRCARATGETGDGGHEEEDRGVGKTSKCTEWPAQPQPLPDPKGLAIDVWPQGFVVGRDTAARGL